MPIVSCKGTDDKKYTFIVASIDGTSMEEVNVTSNGIYSIYYNQNGNDSNQQYVMDSYLRLMRANNSNARATGSTQAQNFYGGTSQEEAKKKIGYEYDPAYDFITNRR